MSLKSAFAVTVMAAAIAGHLDAQYAAMPYSLTMRSVVCCYHDGRRTLPAIGDYFIGQRGDGARVQIVPLPDGSRSRQLEFRAQGLSIQANDKNNYITTIGSGHGLVLPSDVTCRLYGGAKSDRTERLLGFKVLHVASTPVTNPDPNDYDEQDSETWYAPDLGCVVLKEVHWWKWNGQRTGQVTMVEAIKAEAKEPPAEYFAIPSDAIELKPSEYAKAIGEEPNRLAPQMDKGWEQDRLKREAAASDGHRE